MAYTIVTSTVGLLADITIIELIVVAVSAIYLKRETLLDAKKPMASH